jgi:hypothetical protein
LCTVKNTKDSKAFIINSGVYILENPSPPQGGRKISADVIWGKKYEKAKRKKRKM